jgi:hypothetical protein
MSLIRFVSAVGAVAIICAAASSASAAPEDLKNAWTALDDGNNSAAIIEQWTRLEGPERLEAIGDKDCARVCKTTDAGLDVPASLAVDG